MTTPRFCDGVWLGMAWLVACTSTVPNGTDDPAAATAPTRLRLDVPAGLAVEIDGHSQGVTPLALLELPPGEHALAIDSPCGAVERTVTLAPHETTVFAELPTATLTVEARDRKAVRLPVTVTFGDWTIEGAAWTVPSGATVVPACAHRMRVSSPGLGGFVEDIELVADGALTRAVVLTPGQATSARQRCT